MKAIRIKNAFFAFVAVFLMMPALSHAQGNALLRGDWRRALDKCLENPTEVTEYSIYKGEFSGDERLGLGVVKWSGGSYYIGCWNGFMDGLGIYIVPVGYVVGGGCSSSMYYVGEWYSLKTGIGICYDEYGNINYIGGFENDRPTERYPMSGYNNDKFECIEYGTGNYYVGMTTGGKPDGLGFYMWQNGNLWFGEWENGKRNGYGVHMSYEGKITTGDWKDDKKQ